MRIAAGMLVVAIATTSTSFAQDAFAEDVDFDPQRAVSSTRLLPAASGARAPAGEAEWLRAIFFVSRLKK
jgi:hypothetical protein